HECNLQPSARRAWGGSLFMSKEQKQHLDNCKACQAQAANKERTSAGKVLQYIHRRRMNVSNAQSTSAACDNLESQQEKPAVINVDGPTRDDSQDPQGTV